MFIGGLDNKKSLSSPILSCVTILKIYLSSSAKLMELSVSCSNLSNGPLLVVYIFSEDLAFSSFNLSRDCP